MKKILIVITILLLALNFSLANNVYQQDSLELELEVQGEFTLSKESSRASLSSVSANLLLLPQEDYRQTLNNIEHDGELTENSINFNWNEKKIEGKSYGYVAEITTNNQRLEVRERIPFPIENINGLEEYTLPTETIDSDNPLIIAKAAELVEGETDLFKAVFNLASWVEENVEYDLNTLTASASQKASWVLQSKSGVCDEISTLFIAMARSLGIPARFASGISYTTSDLFEENWQPHGWAEVYFPDIGWVSFDLTFGEFGYIDVTHIKLRDGYDPAEPATEYQWLANQVALQPQQLSMNVIIKEQGNFIPEDILLEQEILSPKVGFGSYNLIRGIVKNTAEHYTATTLHLTTPKEVEIIGRNRRNMLLEPKQIKETYWVVKIKDSLDEKFQYTFPSLIYTEKNISVESSFQALSNEKKYSQSEIENLNIIDEEKTYSRKIRFTCESPQIVELDEDFTASCRIKNSGNTNLNELNFCLDETCKVINLKINQEEHLQISKKHKQAGWKKITLSAINDLVEKKDSLDYQAFDTPLIDIQTEYPKNLTYAESMEINIRLKKDSYNVPKDVIVIIKGLGMENRWEIDQLSEEELTLQLDNPPISKNNRLQLTVMWKDHNDKLYSEHQTLEFTGEADNFPDKFRMLINKLINLFNI